MQGDKKCKSSLSKPHENLSDESTEPSGSGLQLSEKVIEYSNAIKNKKGKLKSKIEGIKESKAVNYQGYFANIPKEIKIASAMIICVSFLLFFITGTYSWFALKQVNKTSNTKLISKNGLTENLVYKNASLGYEFTYQSHFNIAESTSSYHPQSTLRLNSSKYKSEILIFTLVDDSYEKDLNTNSSSKQVSRFFNFIRKAYAQGGSQVILKKEDEKIFNNMSSKQNVILQFLLPSPATEMIISNNKDFSNSNWQQVKKEVPWSFTKAEGVKEIYVKFRNPQVGFINEVNSSFILDKSPPQAVVKVVSMGGANALPIDIEFDIKDNFSNSNLIDYRISNNTDNLDSVKWVDFPENGTLQWTWFNSQNDFLNSLKEGGVLNRKVYVQFRDGVNNVGGVVEASYKVDLVPPQLFAEVKDYSDSPLRKIDIYTFDELNNVDYIEVSNDLDFIETDVLEPADFIMWNFDEDRVVWLKVYDSVGNSTEPYPVYAQTLDDKPKPAEVGTELPIEDVPKDKEDINLQEEVKEKKEVSEKVNEEIKNLSVIDSMARKYLVAAEIEKSEPKDINGKKYTVATYSSISSNIDEQRSTSIITFDRNDNLIYFFLLDLHSDDNSEFIISELEDIVSSFKFEKVKNVSNLNTL